jgi:cell division protein FtsB
MQPPTPAGRPSRARPRGADGQRMAADAARERPRFTSRAAVLIVVVCAIALSLAYPVREYIAQLHQIDELRTQQAAITAQLRELKAERTALSSTAYIEKQAENRLQMCFPAQTCYAIIGGTKPAARTAAAHPVVTPWYERLWTSVGEANKASAP